MLKRMLLTLALLSSNLSLNASITIDHILQKQTHLIEQFTAAKEMITQRSDISPTDKQVLYATINTQLKAQHDLIEGIQPKITQKTPVNLYIVNEQLEYLMRVAHALELPTKPTSLSKKLNLVKEWAAFRHDLGSQFDAQPLELIPSKELLSVNKAHIANLRRIEANLGISMNWKHWLKVMAYIHRNTILIGVGTALTVAAGIAYLTHNPHAQRDKQINELTPEKIAKLNLEEVQAINDRINSGPKLSLAVPSMVKNALLYRQQALENKKQAVDAIAHLKGLSTDEAFEYVYNLSEEVVITIHNNNLCKDLKDEIRNLIFDRYDGIGEDEALVRIVAGEKLIKLAKQSETQALNLVKDMPIKDLQEYEDAIERLETRGLFEKLNLNQKVKDAIEQRLANESPVNKEIDEVIQEKIDDKPKNKPENTPKLSPEDRAKLLKKAAQTLKRNKSFKAAPPEKQIQVMKDIVLEAQYAKALAKLEYINEKIIGQGFRLNFDTWRQTYKKIIAQDKIIQQNGAALTKESIQEINRVCKQIFADLIPLIHEGAGTENTAWVLYAEEKVALEDCDKAVEAYEKIPKHGKTDKEYYENDKKYYAGLAAELRANYNNRSLKSQNSIKKNIELSKFLLELIQIATDDLIAKNKADLEKRLKELTLVEYNKLSKDDQKDIYLHEDFSFDLFVQIKDMDLQEKIFDQFSSKSNPLVYFGKFKKFLENIRSGFAPNHIKKFSDSLKKKLAEALSPKKRGDLMYEEKATVKEFLDYMKED